MGGLGDLSGSRNRHLGRAVLAAIAVASLMAAVDGVGVATRVGASDDVVQRAPLPAAFRARPVGPVVTPGQVAVPPMPIAQVVAPTPHPGPRRVMLIGDSMAWTAAEGLVPYAAAAGLEIRNEGIMGCGLVRGGPFRYVGAEHAAIPHCQDWPAMWQAAVDRAQPDVAAIFVGRWELMDRVFQGRWTNLGDPAFQAYIESELEQAISIAGSTGARVVLFTTPYYRRGASPTGALWAEDELARTDAVNALFARVAARRGVQVIDVGGWLSPGRLYTPEINGIRVRSDGVHLTRETGAVLAPWLLPQLAG